MKTLNRLIAFSILFTLMTVQTVSAQEIIHEPKHLSIMFVWDCSESMNRNDPKNNAVEMIEMFIDILPSHRASVGCVAYNHGIASFSKPMSLEKESQRKSLKSKIRRVGKSGFSDMGLGLKKGFELVTANLKENTQPVIVLLSDGETSLSSSSHRSAADSNKDIHYVIEKAKALNMPIYTIEIGDEFEAANTLLTISNETGGKHYNNLVPGDFINVASQVIKNEDHANINPLLAAIGTGQKQEIVIPIEDSVTKEANIILTSQYPIKEPKIFYKGENVSFNQSKNYFAAKIINPTEQEIRLEFMGKSNDTIKAYLLPSYDIRLILDVPDNIQKNKAFHIGAYLKNNIDHKPIKDLKFYDKITPSFWMQSDTQRVDLNVNGSKEKIQAGHRLEYSGDYTLRTLFTHPSFDIECNTFISNVKNNQPQGEFSNKFKLHTASKPKTYPLDKYFHDPDGDVLTYEIINANTEGLEIKDAILTISATHKGNYQFAIKATDNEGLSYESEPINLAVVSTLQYYYPITITVICLLLAALIGTIIHIKRKAPKPTFTGKINAYFISLKDGDEVAPLTFPLYPFENKKRISLEELLLHANIHKPFLNAKEIYFEPGLDKSIVFYNKTSATCMKDAAILRKDVKYSLEYKAKIYITFEDGSEVELHYNRSNPGQ